MPELTQTEVEALRRGESITSREIPVTVLSVTAAREDLPPWLEPGDEGWDAAVSQAVNHLLAREAADQRIIDTWIAVRLDREEA